MRNRLRLTPLVLVVLTLLLTAVALGCAAATPTPTPRPTPTPTVAAPVATPTPTATPTPSAPQPQYGGVFGKTTRRDPLSCDSATIGARTGNESNPCHSLYSRFIRNGYTETEGYFDLIPELVTSWEPNATGDTWTLQLRQGVMFTHGREFTAEDAKFTLERLKLSPSTGRLAALRDGIDSVDILDTYTIQVNLVRPWAGFIVQMANPWLLVYPKDPTENVDFQWADPFAVPGSGPFILTVADRGSRYAAERNPDYWDEPFPYLDGWNNLIVPDFETRAALLETTQVDSSGAQVWPVSIYLDLRDKPHINSKLIFGNFANGAVLSLDVLPFNDVRVRQAVYLTLDANEVNQIVDEGLGIQSHCITGSATDACTPIEEQKSWAQWADTPEERAQKRQEAKQLMIDADYPNGFDVTADYGKLCIHDGRSQFLLTTVYLQQVLEEHLNIRCEVRQVERSQMVEMQRAHDFGFMYGGGARADVSLEGAISTRYLCDSGDNFSGDCDPVIEDYWDQITQELDEARRIQLARELETYYATEHFGPHILMYEAPYIVQWNKRVQDYDPGPGFYHIANHFYANIWIDPAIDPLTGERR
ncbi:MAG: ABC transporter substrate-binding protein [Dehalococcoidia bacterium]